MLEQTDDYIELLRSYGEKETPYIGPISKLPNVTHASSIGSIVIKAKLRYHCTNCELDDDDDYSDALEWTSNHGALRFYLLFRTKNDGPDFKTYTRICVQAFSQKCHYCEHPAREIWASASQKNYLAKKVINLIKKECEPFLKKNGPKGQF